jgi:thymidylate synthase (FAD)
MDVVQAFNFNKEEVMLKRVENKWEYLRTYLFGNVEPRINVDAITTPLVIRDENMWTNIEMLTAIAASMSYGSTDKVNKADETIKINKNLIKLNHNTPLESIQVNFLISGISKACGAQMSHHRIGQGHISASRRFKTAEAGFIYPTLGYIEDEDVVIYELERLSRYNSESYGIYMDMKANGIKKEDARMVLPVSYATEIYWFTNVRALRDFFRLRLSADSEWEIRRLAWMIYDKMIVLLPSLFEGIE